MALHPSLRTASWRAAGLLTLLAACDSDKGLTVHHSPPAATIVSPTEGAQFEQGEAITFTGLVQDDMDAENDLSITWTSDRDGVINSDPADADGNVLFTTGMLSPGTHVITMQVINSQSRSAEDTVGLTIAEVDADPTISVRTPNAVDYGVEGVAFTFSALVSDEQDDPTALTVSFASDLDGEFCTPSPDADGLASCPAALSVGDHQLTMTVTDTDGNSAEVTASFEVIAAQLSDDDHDGYTEDQGDCDDADPSVHPGATEYANGADDDCDGTIDEDTVNVDDDGDGFAEVDGDCDDGDPDTWPGALEVCDGIDNDCDLTIDDGTSCYDDDGDGYTETGGDCDDAAAASYPGAPEMADGADNDCDGIADEGTTAYDDDGDCVCETGPCTASSSSTCGTLTDGDCNDASATVSPLASEVCDSVDNDCDGTADEDAVGAPTWYVDADGDLYGSSSATATGCSAPSGYVSNSSDCNDATASVSPAASESCNGIDDDCDGATDEGTPADASTWYADADGDGYGSASSSTRACSAPAGYVASATDCSDGNASVHPGASEVCDSADNDCNGVVDDSATDATTWYRDSDGDGYGNPSVTSTSCTILGGYSALGTDCDDASAAISPAGTETCDGADQDCDGTIDDGVTSSWYRDADGDGYGDASVVTAGCSAPSGYVANSSDCDDTNSSVSPDTIWYVDSDGDGYGGTATRTQCTRPSGYVSTSTDCNDSSSSAHPGGTESCDGLDNDCDTSVDEINASGCTTYYPDADGDAYGSSSSSGQCLCSPSSSYSVTNHTDCYDSNANAYPGATAYHTSYRGDTSYDYNCDGSSSKRYTSTWDADFACVSYTDGWVSSVPSCGSTGTWGSGCTITSSFTLTYASTSTRTQSCR